MGANNTNEKKLTKCYLVIPKNGVVDPILLCHINGGVLNRAYTDKKGRSYCLGCIEEWLSMNKFYPGTQTPMWKSDLIENTAIDLRVKNLEIFCTNKDSGCAWTGKMQNLISHYERECHFYTIKCNNYECQYTAIRKNVLRHEDVCIFKRNKCLYCELILVEMDKQVMNCCFFTRKVLYFIGYIIN